MQSRVLRSGGVVACGLLGVWLGCFVPASLGAPEPANVAVAAATDPAAVSATGAATAHAQQGGQSGTASGVQGSDVIPGVFLVGIEPGLDGQARRTLLQEYGLLELDWLEGLRVARARALAVDGEGLALRVDGEGQVDGRLSLLARDAGVRFVEPDVFVHLDTFPNDLDRDQWNLHNIGQDGGTPDADIDAPEAWDITVSAADIVIAVVDTGIDLDHPDLVDNLWTNPGEIPDDGVDNDGNGFVDDFNGFCFSPGTRSPDDLDGHGSHLAGTIGARGDNGIGVVGVCWETQLMAVKFLRADQGSLYNATRGIVYAVDNGANIINASFTSTRWTKTLADAVAYAADRDVLVVAAAGNEGVDNDEIPTYPASYDYPNVISVAATDRNDKLASFSNYSATSVDLAAPGDYIYSTSMDGGYATRSGTSQAVPHVAGAAALLWSLEPRLNAEEVRRRVLEGVDVIPALHGKTVTGGRLNLERVLRLGAAL